MNSLNCICGKRVRGMPSNITFEDNSIKVKQTMNDLINAALEECAGELESQVKRNTRVDTGQTKNSFSHYVDADAGEAVIGSTMENAIWEEFGTGEYALHGNGRKGGWNYKDRHGKWHFTNGKTPSRAFWNAYISTKGKIEQRLQNALKGF